MWNTSKLHISESNILLKWKTQEVNVTQSMMDLEHGIRTFLHILKNVTQNKYNLALCCPKKFGCSLIGVWIDTYVFYQSVLQKKTYESQIWSLFFAIHR